MPSKFNIVAQTILKAPTAQNISSVMSSISKGLNGISTTVNVNIPKNVSTQLATINKGLSTTGKHAQMASTEMERLGKMSALAGRRFAAFALATSGIIALSMATKRAVEEAISFDREMVRVAQVTGRSMANLKGLKDEITNLSTGMGVSSEKLAKVSVTLAQTGISAEETAIALKTLAKTELSATFMDITNTTEGAIAIMAQFKQGAGALEGQLSALNAVSAKYAVESEDLVKIIRLSGATFRNTSNGAADSLNELMAIATSVRATTRESAESIGTGLRTIFARMQRPKTIEYLESLGISLRDVKGQFIGALPAVNLLNKALANVPTTDVRYAAIVEELGGLRQQNKVVPMIQQAAMANEAYAVAQRSNNTLSKDAAQAQQALAVQLTKVKEEFNALFRQLSDNENVKMFVTMVLSLSKALIQVASSLERLLPLMALLGSAKLAQVVPQFSRGLTTKFTGKMYASGGRVAGEGSGDTVPAMLTPGEFVLTKRAANKIGINTLNKVNKFAHGGVVGAASKVPYSEYNSSTESLLKQILWAMNGTGNKYSSPNIWGGASGSHTPTYGPQTKGGFPSLGTRWWNNGPINIPGVSPKSNAGISSGVKTAWQNPGKTALGLGIVGYMIQDMQGVDKEFKKLAMTLASAGAQVLIFKSVIDAGGGFNKVNQTHVAKAESIVGRRDVRQKDTLSKMDYYQSKVDYYGSKIDNKTASGADFSKRSAAKKRLAELSDLSVQQGIELEGSRGVAKGVGRAAKFNRIAGIATPVAAVTGMMGGEYLGERGSTRIQFGDYEGGKNSSIWGGVLSGAALGGTVGATAGSRGGVHGAVVVGGIGAGLGALGGGINAATNSDQEIERHKQAETYKEFGKELLRPKTAKGNAIKTSEGFLRDLAKNREGGIISRTMGFGDKGEGEKELKGGLKGSVEAMEHFIDEIVKTSTSVDELYKVAGPTIRLLGEIDGRDYSKERAGYKKKTDSNKADKDNKKAQDDLVKSTEALVRAQNQSMALMFSLESKFNALGASIDVTKNAISGVEGLAHGEVKDVHTVNRTDALQNLAFSNRKDIESQATMAGNIIGGTTGKNMTEEITAMGAALKGLPALLDDIERSGLKGDMNFSHIAGTIKGQLSGNGTDVAIASSVSDFIKNALETELGSLSGTEREGTLKKLRGAGTHLVTDNVAKHFEPNKIAANAIEKATGLLNESGEWHGKKRGLMSQRQDQMGSIFGSRNTLEDMSYKFAEKRLDTDRLIGREATDTTSRFGKGNVESFGETYRDAGAKVANLNIQKTIALEKGQFSEVVRLNKELEQVNDAAENAKKALEYFGDAAKRSAQLQEQLTKLEGERKTKLGLEKTAAFGSPKEKMELARTISGVASIIKDPKEFGKMHPMRQKETFEFLEHIGDQKIAGIQANDILKQIAPQVGITSVKPSDEETKIKETLAQYQRQEIETLRSNIETTDRARIVMSRMADSIDALILALPKTLNPQGKHFGGMIHANKGMMVPGHGNRDSVPAMLTPGEFVLTKNAVSRIGMNNLNAMNFQDGGVVPIAQKRAQAREFRVSDKAYRQYVNRTARVKVLNKQAIINQGIMNNSKARGLSGQPLRNKYIFQHGRDPDFELGLDGYDNKTFRKLFPGDRKNKGVNYVGNQADAAIKQAVKNARGGFKDDTPQHIKDMVNRAKKDGAHVFGYHEGKNGEDIGDMVKKARKGVNVFGGHRGQGGENINDMIKRANAPHPELHGALNNFHQGAAPMIDAMNQFPRAIDMAGNHKVEVVINGAQVMTGLIPQIQGLVESETRRAINKMIRDKFPDVGQV